MDRRSWTQQEDQAITSLVDQFGLMDWTNISQKLKQRYSINERTGKQCRERWYNHLNPQVNKKPWNEQQQKLLFQIHRKSGNKWKLMSRYFQGRTDNDIKNHFYSTLRRSLRRLNKFIGEKNSTTQMREIKPSVLSTIMNYIYQQENNIETNIVNSLKDLPYLVFEFSNYKPVKGKVKVQEDEIIKEKINFIFLLINKANATYQMLKESIKSGKGKRVKASGNSGGENDRGEQHEQHNHCKSSTQDMLTTNNYNSNNNKQGPINLFNSHLNPINNAANIQLAQHLDFFKYLPKKSYSSINPNTSSLELSSPLNNIIKKPRQKSSKIIRNNPPITLSQVKIQQQEQEDDCCSNSKENKCYSKQQLQSSNGGCLGMDKSGNNNNKYSMVQRLERELSTDLMCQQFGEYNVNSNNNSNNINNAIISSNNYSNTYNNNYSISNMLNNIRNNSKRDSNSNNNNTTTNIQGLDNMKQRRISLQEYQDFIQDSDIGQVQQPSDVSGFYCSGNNNNNNNNSFQDLVVVGRQVTLHQSLNYGQVKMQQHHEDNSNIDELIEMNYEH